MNCTKTSFRQRPGLVATGALVAGILGIGAAGCALSDEPTPDHYTAPGRHVTVPDVLSDLGGDHFAGVEVQGQHIVSYWVDDVPPEAREYAESEPEGMTIELVTSARFSRSRLAAAAGRVVNSEVGRHAGISWASAESDGSGLEIAIEGDERSPAMKREIAALAELPEDAIHYTPHAGPVVRTPTGCRLSSAPRR